MKALVALLVLSILISCGHDRPYTGEVVDKVTTYDKYGYPFFYVMVRADDDKGVYKYRSRSDYYKYNIGDLIIVK